MSKFKQVPNVFLVSKIIEFFKNIVKNYNDEIRNDNFFDFVRNCFDHYRAIELIEAAYTSEELEAMRKSRSRRGRVDLSDTLDSVFSALWNNEMGREKCRIILESICEYMDASNKKSASELIESRFLELKRALKLNDLEYGALLVMYVVNQTCFTFPCRIDNRDKPLFVAMALDRSYNEVLNVMSPRGKLRKFDLLDKDWDFNCRTIGNYIDGVDGDAIERRFYKKVEDNESTPWNFFGELSSKDGELLKKMLAANPRKCNILLYGAPGTGKTSFARALAREAGRTAWEIKQGDDDGRNMKSEARLVGIQICNEQEAPDESVVLVDEADELLRDGHSLFSMLFGGGAKGATEKGVVNTILDGMKIPAIWISNTRSNEIDESVRRRFDYSICFERLNNAQRMAIWRNVVSKHGLGKLIGEDKISNYAEKYETSAGGISLVLKTLNGSSLGPPR